MTAATITLLIAEAESKRIWLRSVDRQNVWFSPAYARAMGAEKMADERYFPNGWVLADAREIARKRKEQAK